MTTKEIGNHFVAICRDGDFETVQKQRRGIFYVKIILNFISES